MKTLQERIFPVLENLVLNRLNKWDQDCPMIVNKVLKCLMHCMRLEVSEYFIDENKMATWMNILLRILQMNFNNQNLLQNPENTSQQEKLEKDKEWKLKTNASNIMSVFFCFSKIFTQAANEPQWKVALGFNFIKTH